MCQEQRKDWNVCVWKQTSWCCVPTMRPEGPGLQSRPRLCPTESIILLFKWHCNLMSCLWLIISSRMRLFSRHAADFDKTSKTLTATTSVIMPNNPFNCYLEVSVALISHQQSRNLSQSSLMKLALMYASSLLLSTSIDWLLMRLWGSRLVQNMWFVAIWCDTDLFTLCGQGKSIYHVDQTETYGPEQAGSRATVWRIGRCQLWIVWALSHLKPFWFSHIH